MEYIITPSSITVDEIISIVSSNAKIKLSSESIEKIQKCRTYLDTVIEESSLPIYGINTGFGALCNEQIEPHQLSQLQENLVKSHAAGCGDHTPKEVVRIMLLLKIKSLALGYSAISLKTINALIQLFNHNISPVIYDQGSLGASGDLAPLAHMSLPLLHLGEVYENNSTVDSKTMLSKLNIAAIQLESKEGLALLNGTQFMSAYGVKCINESEKIIELANLIASVSIDSYNCLTAPFEVEIHDLRLQEGQQSVANSIRNHLNGSDLHSTERTQVQDPYSFRCIPQVHGASLEAINYVKSILNKEINAVTDNPIVIPEKNKILSGGNFHGQPIAMAMEFLGLALAELGSISERRTFKLISGTRGLPPFLINEAGFNSGFMIAQYTAASIVSQNKQFCTPAVVDTIDSSNGQEDHVSMGANSASKCFKIVQNVKKILSIEFLCATQAKGFRKNRSINPEIELYLKKYRQEVPFMEKDETLYDKIADTKSFLFN